VTDRQTDRNRATVWAALMRSIACKSLCVMLPRGTVQVDAKEDEARSYVFITQGWKKAKKLLVLIQGSETARAGEWARRYVVVHIDREFEFYNNCNIFLNFTTSRI